MRLIVADGSDKVPGVASGVRAFQGRWVFRLVGAGVSGLGERGADTCPGGGDRFGPPPSGVDRESGSSGAAGDAGGDGQDPLAEGVDFAAGQVRVIGKADQFGPCDQICCGHDDFQSCRVRVEGVEREITQPGGLGFRDAVLHPGVLAVAQFQAGELAAGCWARRRAVPLPSMRRCRRGPRLGPSSYPRSGR